MKNRAVIAFLLCTLALASPAFGLSYFGYDDFGGTWHDAEKSFANTEDDLMCWAAAASNILDWTGWDTATYATETQMFQNFQDHWTDQGSLMGFGWDWWLNGTLPPNWAGWSQVDVAGGGNYWPAYNFSNYFYEDWTTANVISSIDSWLHTGYGVSLAIYGESGVGAHAITVWGYEYDGSGNYLGLYVTDSDDYITQLAYYTVSWDAGNGWWDLGGGYSGWYIGGVQALDQGPNFGDRVPEPGTLMLIGSGLLGIVGLGRKRFLKRNG